MLLKVAIIDDRDSYRERLVTALAESYADKLEVTSFSSVQAFDDSLASSSPVDVMLVSADLGNEQLDGRRGATLIYLSDDRDIEQVYGAPAICRYQKMDLIYKEMLENSLDKFDFVTFRSESIEGTSVISFFPASGGVGASTLAAACALGAAKRGMHVFYLNLEMYGQASSYFTADGNGNVSDALFAVMAKKHNLAMRIQSQVKRTTQNVYFLESCRSPLDLADLTGDHVSQLVHGIATSGAYDVIVIDLDYANSRIASAVMELSDRTVFVSNGSATSNGKLTRILGVLRGQGIQESLTTITDNMVLVYNNFDRATGTYLETDALTTLGAVGRMPASEPARLVDALSNSAVVDELLRDSLLGAEDGR